VNVASAFKKYGINVSGAVIGADFNGNRTLKCDCPKDYCKNSRSDDDKTPLLITIFGEYAEWKCHNCLWAGHIGERPTEVSAAPATEPPKAPLSKYQAFLTAKGMTEEEAAKYKLGYDDTTNTVKIPYFDGPDIINALLIKIDGKTKLASQKNITFYGLDRVAQGSPSVILAQRELDAIILSARGFQNVIALPNGGEINPKADEYAKDPDKFS